MVTFAFVLLTAVVAALANPDLLYDLEDAEEHFQEFIDLYGKQYNSSEEKAYRFEIFKQSLIKHNKQNLDNPLADFGIHEYSDLSPDEFGKLRTGYVPLGGDNCKLQQTPEDNPPASWDWRNYNAVGRVKAQGQCGSCWTFSAIGNVEGQYAIKHGSIIHLSEKQLLDCDTEAAGCDGGWPRQAFTFLQQVGGVMTEKDYPYSPVQQRCSFDKRKVRVQVTGCDKWRFSNEEDIKKVLHKRGPLSVVIDATDMGGYNGKLVTKCRHYPGSRGLHAVLLVGYGSENGVNYWVFKNSWGTTFGENGYFKAQRGINICGLLDFYVSSSIIA
ncbi:ervatamin-B-like [Hyposmocoma kahamanoa]|uniref:ervatamin-B-like n=1 Tax=Hyposmocoma kahamanoa TaxID=1477025 RepID=UPI000E6D5E79|nr:ervatamin-B-like [Hyposmocoma kahamanoa]